MLRAYINSTLGESFPFITDLWPQMGWFSRGLVLLLGLMLLDTFFILLRQLLRFGQARGQSQRYLNEARHALREGDCDAVLACAVQYPRSHVAAVIKAGVEGFVSAPEFVSDDEAVEIAERAMRRAQERMRAELRLGIPTLSAIAASAPFIGLLGTQIGILNAFGAFATNKATWIAWTAASVANALALAAMGMLVAIFAVWLRGYLKARVEAFDTEMSNTALEMVTYLNAHRAVRSERLRCESAGNLFEITDGAAVRRWEIPYDRQRAILLAMTLCALFIPATLGLGVCHWVARLREGPVAEYKPPKGEEAVSPDMRYRAETPPKDWCRWFDKVSLRVISNDRAPAWHLQHCPRGDRYELEPDEALRISNCAIPQIMWRTNEELLVQCTECSAKDLELVKLDLGARRITVLGADGKRIRPKVVAADLCASR